MPAPCGQLKNSATLYSLLDAIKKVSSKGRDLAPCIPEIFSSVSFRFE